MFEIKTIKCTVQGSDFSIKNGFYVCYIKGGRAVFCSFFCRGQAFKLVEGKLFSLWQSRISAENSSKTFCFSTFKRYFLCSELKENSVLLLRKVNSHANVESKFCTVEHCHKLSTGWKGRFEDVFESD